MAKLKVRPLTPDRWDDLLELFGPSGAYSGCWCMWWRVTSKEFSAEAGKRLKKRFKKLVDDEEVPGLLGYLDGELVGWVSLGPREQFGRLQRSPKLKSVDDTPVWSIVCFYIKRGHRGTGVATQLLDGAIKYAKRRGAVHVEGYPIDASRGRKENAAMFTGALAMFDDAGFEEIERRGGRPIVRRKTH